MIIHYPHPVQPPKSFEINEEEDENDLQFLRIRDMAKKLPSYSFAPLEILFGVVAINLRDDASGKKIVQGNEWTCE